MPDLTIETMSMCRSCEQWTRNISKYTQHYDYRMGEGYTCNCPGFTYRRRCKHVEQAQREHCGWHEQWSDEQQDDFQRERQICPRCGGPTQWVRVGV